MFSGRSKYFSRTLFFEVFKQILTKIAICFFAFFALTLLVDFTNNYEAASNLGYGFTKFLYFETALIIDLLSESMAFVVCIAFIWFFLSFSLSGANRISLTFGINPYKIITPAMLSVGILIVLYLFILKSLFIDISNEAQYLMLEFKSKNRQVSKIGSNITIVKKSKDEKDTIILYLNNPYYKKIKAKNGDFSYQINPAQISILTYNQNVGVKNWQTFAVKKITQANARPSNINIELISPQISDLLFLQQSGIEVLQKNQNYSIIFDCNINLIINQIDIEGKNIFVFSFVSLPFKIASLKLQGLSYSIFENQFYALIKNAMLLVVAMLVPMYFLFNISARSFIILRLILSAILVFLFTFVFCYFLSTQAALLKNSLLIAFLNITPPIFMINLFLFFNLKRHC